MLHICGGGGIVVPCVCRQRPVLPPFRNNR
jgi:hypothetical protein